MSNSSSLTQKLVLLLNAYLPPVIWAGVIFVFSSQQSLPGFEVSLYDFLLKKGAHMFVYAVLYLLLHRAVCLTIHKKRAKVRVLAPILLLMIYAISDELHQSLVPNRYATLRDVGYDILGASLVFMRIYKYI